MSFTPKLPLRLNEDENYEYIKEYINTLKQNFNILLFTNPGERFFDPEFGIGIKKYLFELASGYVGMREDQEEKTFFLENYSEKLYKSLLEQLLKYLPAVKIDFVKTKTEKDILYIELTLTFANFMTEVMIFSESLI